jgi:hypothetical protein
LAPANEVEGKVVKLKRLQSFDVAFHAALSSTLNEWTTEADEEGFFDL